MFNVSWRGEFDPHFFGLENKCWSFARPILQMGFGFWVEEFGFGVWEIGFRVLGLGVHGLLHPKNGGTITPNESTALQEMVISQVGMLRSTWTPKVCKRMALMTVIVGLGLLCYMLLGFR